MAGPVHTDGKAGDLRVIIFEDDDKKFDVVKEHFVSRGVLSTGILRLKTVAEFARIGSIKADLCVIDLRMPGVEGTASRSSGIELLRMLEYSGFGRIPTFAITSFPDEAEFLRDDFAARGCIIYDYNKPTLWKQAADLFLSQARDRGRYDFVIFTALAEERQPFATDPRLTIDSTMRYGLNHWDCSLGELSGTIVLLPRMGLVDAAITIARTMELYEPRVVAMSGICAGLKAKSKMGQLLIADVCFEYQSGKWIDDIFESSPYQSKLTPQTRLVLEKMTEQPDLVGELEVGVGDVERPSRVTKPSLEIFATGSAVVASETWLDLIKVQHRKVAGIDMELFGLYRAVESIAPNISFFGAKVVVDQGDASKNDNLHKYGCHVSARFVISALLELSPVI